MNFYAFHMGDYLTATKHLSWDEDIAYRRMLDAYYQREAPLPLDLRQIYRLVGASEDRQREAVQVVLSEFFEQTPEGYRNQRADEEIAKTSTKKEKARESAAKRWQSDRNANASDNHANASPDHANAVLTQSEGNAPNPNPILEIDSAREVDHRKGVEAILKRRDLDHVLNEWDIDFLRSIRRKATLTPAQAESLKGIEGKLADTTPSQPDRPKNTHASTVWIWKGTPQWEAWSKGRPRPWPTKDQRHPDGSMRPGWFFPSEWPPNAPASPQEAA